MQFQSLKQRHRQELDAQHPNLRLRVHRALSWLDRAEQADDLDGRFIFLWIAFNAAYATEIDERQRLSEQETLKAFLEKLSSLDESKRIDTLVWQELSSSIRVLLDNPHVFQRFWDHQSGKIDGATWKTRFASGKRAAQQVLACAVRRAVQAPVHTSQPAYPRWRYLERQSTASRCAIAPACWASWHR